MKTLQGWKTFIKEKEKEIKKASGEMINILNSEIVPGIKEIVDSYGEYINVHEIRYKSNGEEYFGTIDSIEELEILILLDTTDDSPVGLVKEISDRIISEFGQDLYHLRSYKDDHESIITFILNEN